MYPQFYTSWLTPQPTRQRKWRKPQRPQPTRHDAKRGHTSFGQHRATFGALMPRGDYWWQGDTNVYPFDTVYHVMPTPGAVLSAAAKAQGK